MSAFDNFLNKVFGTRSDRILKKYRPTVVRIGELEAGLRTLSDVQLQAKTPFFKERINNGAPLDEILPEAFAVVREAGRRVLEMRHFDVQLLGGMVLHNGMVAEMRTGEGKTLVGTLPVYLNALSGKGAHVVTVNDYLASRDADWMGRIYTFLGLSVGKVLQSERDQGIKQRAYLCDITYGTNNEFGFDYLRDNMKFRAEEYVQRGHNFAIVDEVDSILIDEARTPLIISGPTNQPIDRYVVIDGVIPLLQAEIDYAVDEKARSVALTDSGVDRIEDKLGIDNLYDPHNMEILHHVNQALKAHTIFKRDRDYVVQGGKVVIVDEQTGRLMSGRRWSDGLHQAVEAKEKVEVEAESQTYATITFQNYFRMYTKLAGMTGTAETEAEEFQKIYNLDVVVVPTNRPITRDDHHDIVYKTQGEKFRAVLDEIEASHKKGQPVLVGTVSVEKSDIVSRLLRQRGIPHELLNAKQHAREAEIVSQAGRIGSVTISTNMAGRGTDIKLGGDPEGLAKLEAHPELQPEAYKAAHARFAEQCSAERERVLAVGGLHILGTERHESRRIDNQLRGRAGRQGDPGSSRFYLSLEDDLLRIFGGDKLVGWMERMGMQEDERIEHRWITSSIENAQKKVEGHNFNIRKNLLEYDDVMNLQRRAVYDMRRKALLGESIREMVVASVDALIDDVLDECVQEGVTPEQWNVEGFRERLDKIFTLQWDETDDGLRDHAWEEIRQRLITEAHRIYEERESAAGAEAMRQVERMLLLQFTDSYWKDHLLAMDRLRDGIGLRGYGQKNPLLEYKKEGTEMFLLMNSLRDEAVVSRLLRLEIQAEAAPRVTKANARRLAETPVGEPDEEEIDPSQLLAVAPQAPPARPAPPPPPAPVRPQPGTEARAFARLVGLKRNEPCPCGSGKKYKKCCYDEAEDEAVAAAEAAAAEAAAEAAAAGEEVDPAAPLVVSAEAAAELPTEPPAELPAEAAAGGETGVGFEGESTVLASVEGGAPAFGGSVADPDLLAPTEAPTETIDLGRRDA